MQKTRHSEDTPRSADRPWLRACLVSAVLVAGALLSIRAFHLELMVGSGVLVATNPWNHSVMFCSLHGCYALSPM